MSALATLNLLTELQFASDRHVATVICLMQVIQQPAALADHLQQTPAGTMVFGVLLQMLSEVVDTLCEQSNLNVGTAGIAVMHLKRFNCFVLLFHTVRFQIKNPDTLGLYADSVKRIFSVI
jgi:hypothetical protein